ncbi:hypothetical protein D3C74_435450 [compost metagenome]
MQLGQTFGDLTAFVSRLGQMSNGDLKQGVLLRRGSHRIHAKAINGLQNLFALLQGFEIQCHNHLYVGIGHLLKLRDLGGHGFHLFFNHLLNFLLAWYFH